MEKSFLIIVLIVTLVTLIQLGLGWGMQIRVGKTAPDISGLLACSPAKDDCMVDNFYSLDCHACKPMTPLIEEMRKQHITVLSVVLNDQSLPARDFGIMATLMQSRIEDYRICAMRTGTPKQKQLDRLLARQDAND